MGIIQRQGFKGMIGTYAGFLLGYLNLLILYPYFLSPEEIGLMRVFIDLGLVLGSLSMFGSDSSIIRFAPIFKDRDPEKLSGLLVFFSIIVLIGSCLVSAIYYFNNHTFIKIFGKNMPQILDLFVWIIPLIFLNALNLMYERLISIKGRIAVPVFVREVFVRLGYSILVVLYAFQLIEFEQLLKLIPIIVFVQFLFLLYYVRSLGFSFKPDYSFFTKDKKLMKEYLNYSSFLLIYVLAGVFISKIDIFMLSSMKGAQTTGIYTIAFYIGIVVSIPKRSLLQISNPIVSELTRKKDTDGIKKIYQDSSINMLVISMLIFLGIWFNLPLIYEIMPNGELFEGGKWVVALIGVSFIVQLAAGVGSAILTYSKYFFYALWYSLLSIVIAIISNLILIPNYGMNGAAFGTLLTNVVLLIAIVAINHFKGKVQPFTLKTLYAALLFSVLIILNEWIGGSDLGLVLITAKGIVLILLFIWLTYKMKLSSQLNKLAQEAIAYVKHYFVRPSGRR